MGCIAVNGRANEAREMELQLSVQGGDAKPNPDG